MKYYSVLDVTFKNQDWVASYLPVANELMKEYGGKYLARTSHFERLEGEDTAKPNVRIIIEWPSKEAAEGFMKDERYAPHLAAGTAGTISNHYLIEGIDELA